MYERVLCHQSTTKKCTDTVIGPGLTVRRLHIESIQSKM